MFDFETLKTTQDIANFVYNKMMAQGKRSSIGGAGGCVYRADDGSKCAVGHLIPDELFRPEMEGDVDDLINNIILFLAICVW